MVEQKKEKLLVLHYAKKIMEGKITPKELSEAKRFSAILNHTMAKNEQKNDEKLEK